MIVKKSRKKRSDRNHLIYTITHGKSLYIGVTQIEGRSINKSLKRRWQKHVCRAKTENHNWKLYTEMRRYGPEAFVIELLEIVRGKSAAHERERQLIDKHHPNLNTDIRSSKARKERQ